jgi:5-carboxymethyl-2-hydroxymuconate isomerase
MQAESKTIDALVAEIAGMFPQYSPLRIRAVVLHHWARFDEARVRDYLPMLVRLRVISELRAST